MPIDDQHASDSARRATAEGPPAIDPAEVSDLELLTALQEGRIRLDQVGDGPLEAAKARLGARGLAQVVAPRPSQSDADQSRSTSMQQQNQHRVAGLGRLRIGLAAAAAAALCVTTVLVMRDGGLGQPGEQTAGEDVRFEWPKTRHQVFIPDTRLAIDWRGPEVARDLPDFSKPSTITMGPDSGQRQHMQLATVIVTFDGGFGSGAVISDDGWILTNYHVVEAEAQRAALQGGTAKARIFFCKAKGNQVERIAEPVPATLYRVSPQHDLALLKLDNVPESIKPVEHFAIASGVEPGDEILVVGSQSKGPAWMLRTGNVASIFQYPEGLSDEVIRSNSSAAAAVHRMRSEVICTDARISNGDSGGPLLNGQGLLVGLTFATPSNLSVGSLGYHVGLKHVREFVRNLPETPEAVPPDLWEGATPDCIRQGPVPVDLGDDGSADALRFGFSVAGPGGGEPRPIGVALFADFDARMGTSDISAEQILNTIPRGLWGMEDRGQFKWNIAVVVREDGPVIVGYPDASGVLSEIRLGSKDGQTTTHAWARGKEGAWALQPSLAGKPLIDSAKVAAKHRATLGKLRQEVFGGKGEPEPDKPLRPGKQVPGKPGPSGPGGAGGPLDDIKRGGKPGGPAPAEPDDDAPNKSKSPK